MWTLLAALAFADEPEERTLAELRATWDVPNYFVPIENRASRELLPGALPMPMPGARRRIPMGVVVTGGVAGFLGGFLLAIPVSVALTSVSKAD